MKQLHSKTKKQRILEALLNAKLRRIYWFSNPLPGGYLTTGHLCNPNVGGSSAPRRIREMRADGIEIDLRLWHCKDRNDVRRWTWIYKLETDPEQIDLQRGKLKPMGIAG